MSEWIDWADPRREDVFRFVMVDPNNLNLAYGELDDVLLDETSLRYGYYTDTRASGEINFLEGNYVPGSWIRVIHEVPAANYQKELGTFIPVSPSSQIKGEAVVQSRVLQSALWGIKDDLAPNHFSIAKNGKAIDAFQKACSICGREYVIDGAGDYKYTTAKSYEIGESYLSILFDIADRGQNRLDVDGHGHIVLRGYINPANATPVWTLDVDDPRSIIRDGSLTMTSTINEVANKTIVLYTNGKKEISAFAELPADSEYSRGARGYTIAELYSVNSLSPAKTSTARSMAERYLKTNEKSIQWQMDTLYFPCECGDTVNLLIGGELHVCMIQTIDPLNLATMTMSLVLKELHNG